MDNVVYDENSIMRKHFAWLDNVVDMKHPTVMKSSNVDGKVVADKFVDGHLHNFTHCSNENVQLYKQAYDEVCNKDKGFDMEFGALVGCPDKYMRHEMNKVGTSNICLVCV
ncbi:hypothetical protein HanPI659440_Chr09g0323981 [Helianthus annuus]|nr:hypothetical protein HanPI659440_Chr09g0323981 [Helianthus annuus]